MKLVVRARTFDANADPLCAIITLNEGMLIELAAQRRCFEQRLAESPEIAAMSFRSGAASYYHADGLRDLLPADAVELLDEHDVVEVPDGFVVPFDEERTECERVTLLADGVFWEAGFRHTDDRVETAILVIEGLLKRPPPLP